MDLQSGLTTWPPNPDYSCKQIKVVERKGPPRPNTTTENPCCEGPRAPLNFQGRQPLTAEKKNHGVLTGGRAQLNFAGLLCWCKLSGFIVFVRRSLPPTTQNKKLLGIIRVNGCCFSSSFNWAILRCSASCCRIYMPFCYFTLLLYCQFSKHLSLFFAQYPIYTCCTYYWFRYSAHT